MLCRGEPTVEVDRVRDRLGADVRTGEAAEANEQQVAQGRDPQPQGD